RLAELERQTLEPGFWDDPAAAQATMREITDLRATVDLWRGLERQVNEDQGILDLAESENDDQLTGEIERSADEIGRRLEDLEFERTLGGPYDRRPAIVHIHARAGGTEAQDWTQMLVRMYLRWGERRGFKAEILDEMPGEEAGLKSATLEFRGPFAYGYL